MSTRIFCLFVLSILIVSGGRLAYAQESQSPVIIRPGAPGQESRQLPADTRAKLPPVTAKDIEFMQGMIMHHAQAVEMTALIALRTKNPEIIRLGEKISQSQSDEMSFMRLWLEIRNAPAQPAGSNGMKHSHGGKDGMMPGMLSFERMEELREATGSEFDRLFLVGMIEHHEGALWMVRDLFKSAGAGQDAELFNFATDVDSGQRAEIKVMQMLLEKLGLTEKK